MVASRSGGPIPQPVARTVLVDAHRLETAVEALWERSELRLLVGLVERWEQVGTPTLSARLRQVEALLDLCQTERAAARLDRAPPARGDLSRLKVEARLLVERGWLAKARSVIEEAHALAPGDPDLQRLAERVSNPVVPPAALADTAPFADRLAAAEALLRTGATHSGRRLLEALDREQPGHPRVADLLWALEDVYELPGSLEEVVGTFAPDPGDGVVLDASDDAASAVEDTQVTRLSDVEAAVDRMLDEADEDTAVLRVEGRWLEEETGVFRIPGLAREIPPPPVPEPPPPPDDEDEGVVLVTRDTPAPPPRTARPLPVPEAPRIRRRPPEPEPADLQEIQEVEAVDEPAAEAETPAATLPPDDVPYGLLLASAAVLGITGLIALGALFWMASQ